MRVLTLSEFLRSDMGPTWPSNKRCTVSPCWSCYALDVLVGLATPKLSGKLSQKAGLAASEAQTTISARITLSCADVLATRETLQRTSSMDSCCGLLRSAPHAGRVFPYPVPPRVATRGTSKRSSIFPNKCVGQANFRPNATCNRIFSCRRLKLVDPFCTTVTQVSKASKQ